MVAPDALSRRKVAALQAQLCGDGAVGADAQHNLRAAWHHRGDGPRTGPDPLPAELAAASQRADPGSRPRPGPRSRCGSGGGRRHRCRCSPGTGTGRRRGCPGRRSVAVRAILLRPRTVAAAGHRIAAERRRTARRSRRGVPRPARPGRGDAQRPRTEPASGVRSRPFRQPVARRPFAGHRLHQPGQGQGERQVQALQGQAAQLRTGALGPGARSAPDRREEGRARREEGGARRGPGPRRQLFARPGKGQGQRRRPRLRPLEVATPGGAATASRLGRWPRRCERCT